MGAQDRNISPPRIRQLDEAAINRIAAGEVVERPASAVKELVENALDARASRIRIEIADGGRTLIRVTDDGHGIAAEDLPLALSRHATSKIDGTDLLQIHSFGFRGEALPSLGAVGRLTITTRATGSDGAMSLHVSGGRIDAPRPAALRAGTVVELRDLFHATPARLKFLKSERSESMAVTDAVRRLAMAEPGVAFDLRDVSDGEDKVLFRADPAASLADRLATILGRAFAENCMTLDAEREGHRLTGHAGLPTYSRGNAVHQYLFVNGRPVRDRMLTGALRGAYADVLAKDRHAVAALFITCPPTLVDCNVHPAKTEVRFRDAGLVRGLIVSGLKHALAEAGHRSATTVATATLGAARAEPPRPAAPVYQMDRPSPRARDTAYTMQMPGFADASARVEPAPEPTPDAAPGYLGAARAQLHETYILSQTETGFVLVDQHAAHERLVYERLKAQAEAGGIAAQALLIPEVVEVGPWAERLLALDLSALGLGLDPFGPGCVAVRETPALLGPVSAEALIRDIIEELEEDEDATPLTLRRRLDAILSRMSCHGSIRAGRRMSAPEMNALLREMEATPMSGQCNHGRPTYVSLDLKDIERLFGRT
ncbi:DNA mismatch repair endonuclease MutL [Jannaschia seohaensis]|uniref:DNA mismatch repair protein MutL n=1 Tax=Jannaschia seohaensis TaxID=475081 RepID=A0A2Y9A7W3_9RHOB|nr:DNA mismatch repair endonuclease MutL [Jannaschia seohaensis]PWJ21989.1 DNA mismatch repair protein MutL [Jannaschia seohaensis]SSA38267.1 DNA mismatch repair protein MutL [Jannaschia seohaensis]